MPRIKKNKRAQAPAPSRRGTRTRRQHPSVPIEDPPLPNGADPINIENKLHILPRYTKRDWSHPWYFYDIIEPAPQFRKIPDDYLVDPKDPHISEGEDSDDLSDTPGEDKLPVYTPGYIRKFYITVPDIEDYNNGDSEEAELFSYRMNDSCKVSVRPIIRNPHLSLAQKETTDPTPAELGKAKIYTIHVGYLRILAGMTREIKFLTEDKLGSHNCVFRAVYLMKVLDLFANELAKLGTETSLRFRSPVLNPILQRQLRGIHDHEPAQVLEAVGNTLEDATDFYLKFDPLNPRHIPTILRNLLYVWHVRLSISFLYVRCTEDAYEGALRKTDYLITQRAKIPDDEWDAEILNEDEYQIIEQDLLNKYYQGLIECSGVKQKRAERIALGETGET